MTNYDKYFGTSECAAESIAGANDFLKDWYYWADNNGALICSLTPSCGNGKTKRQAEAFQAFLGAEAKEES